MGLRRFYSLHCHLQSMVAREYLLRQREGRNNFPQDSHCYPYPQSNRATIAILLLVKLLRNPGQCQQRIEHHVRGTVRDELLHSDIFLVAWYSANAKDI
jgi:hypothetical protein